MDLATAVTHAEKENAEKLKNAYKFIFVNVAHQQHLILEFADFFHEKVARIYPTWSVFITEDLNLKNETIIKSN